MTPPVTDLQVCEPAQTAPRSAVHGRRGVLRSARSRLEGGPVGVGWNQREVGSLGGDSQRSAPGVEKQRRLHTTRGLLCTDPTSRGGRAKYRQGPARRAVAPAGSTHLAEAYPTATAHLLLSPRRHRCLTAASAEPAFEADRNEWPGMSHHGRTVRRTRGQGSHAAVRRRCRQRLGRPSMTCGGRLGCSTADILTRLRSPETPPVSHVARRRCGDDRPIGVDAQWPLAARARRKGRRLCTSRTRPSPVIQLR